MATPQLFIHLLRKHYLSISAAAVVLINYLYFFSYPINIASYDYPNYAWMIYSNSSNLIHASGYALIMRTLLNLLNIPNGASIFDVGWLNSLQTVQLTLHISILLICTVLCNKLFGKVSALITCIAWGASVFFMGGVNAVAPDWLLGDLLALSLLLSAYAFFTKTSFKTTLYIISWLILTIGYLVKFNVLVVAPILAIFIIFDSKSILWKGATLLATGACSAITIFLFIVFFHYPTTGAKQLSYDHAWVLTQAIPGEYINEDPDVLGINSLRWLALSAIVPPDYFRAGAYQNINWGAPIEVKASYLEKYENIMHFSRTELIYFLKQNKLPTAFNMAVSAIPIYYYIGLPEGDALGIATFKESLRTEPVTYTLKIVNGWKNFLFGGKLQIAPFYSTSLDLNISEDTNESGFVTMSPPNGRIPQHMNYWNPSETAWRAGVRFFGTLNNLAPPSWLYSAVFFLSCIGLYKNKKHKNNLVSAIFVISTIMLVTSSSLLLGVRFKELLVIIPIITMLFSIGLPNTLLLIYTKISKNKVSLYGEKS